MLIRSIWACRIPSPALFHAMDMDFSLQPVRHPKLRLAPPAHPNDVVFIPRWGCVTGAATMGKSIGLFQTYAPGWAYTISPVQQLFPHLPRARLGDQHVSSL